MTHTHTKQMLFIAFHFHFPFFPHFAMLLSTKVCACPRHTSPQKFDKFLTQQCLTYLTYSLSHEENASFLEQLLVFKSTKSPDQLKNLLKSASVNTMYTKYSSEQSEKPQFYIQKKKLKRKWRPLLIIFNQSIGSIRVNFRLNFDFN